MAKCPRCGAEFVPPYRFCSACGQALGAAAPYAPAPLYPSSRTNNIALMVVIVVVVFAVGLVSLAVISSLFSHPSSSPNTTSKPTVTLSLTKVSGGVSIVVAGIQPASTPGNFRVNIRNATSMEAGLGVALPVPSGTSAQISVSGVTFTIVWNDADGSMSLSQGDTFVVTSAAPVGTHWSFLLVWEGDGSVLPTATNWQA